MSITFSLPYGTLPAATYEVTCTCGDMPAKPHPGPWHKANEEADRLNRETPCPGPYWGTWYADAVHPEGHAELNVANVNGFSILRALGIEADYSGSVEPEIIADGLAEVANLNPRYAQELAKVAAAAKGFRTEVVWS